MSKSLVNMFKVMNEICDNIESFNKYRDTKWLNEDNLGILIKVASYDIWGGIRIDFDADNFYPPAARCWLFGACGVGITTAWGCGNTIPEAILRAVWHRNMIQNGRSKTGLFSTHQVTPKEIKNLEF